jgi:hypothetical protein
MQMEYSGAVYTVILNGTDLRQSLMGEAHSLRWSTPATAVSQVLGVWLAATLRVLATRVVSTPASCIPDRPVRSKEVCHVRPAAHERRNSSTPA